MSLRFKLALLFSLMLMTALFAFGTGMHVAASSPSFAMNAFSPPVRETID